MKKLKNIQKKATLIMLVVVLTASSCSKWLDLKPEDGLIGEDYWQTKEQLEAGVIGCYASMLGGSKVPLAKYLFLWGELRGDMVRPSADPSSDEEFSSLSDIKRDEVNIMRSDILSDNSIVNWEAVYRTINLCNLVIENGPQVIESDKTLSNEVLNAYLAEAHGLRGLMYFYLLRTFGEVPLKLEPTSSDDDIKQLAKSDQQEVYTQILSDLNFAAQHALSTYPKLAEEKGRINKYTAYTILADAYLWMEDYKNAIEACNQVIASAKYQIFPAGTLSYNWYNSVFLNGNSVEGIFELQFYAGKQNPFWDMFGSTGKELVAADWVTEGDLYGIKPSDALYSDDLRSVSVQEGNGTINKYVGMRTSSTSFNHFIFYRYADVLLMKAEALTWLEPGNVANGEEALAIVNNLRLKRGALPSVAGEVIETPAASSSEAITDYILRERAREFAFEGKRWFDVLRNAKRNNYQYEQILIDMVSSSAIPSKQQMIIAKYLDHRSHYLPIYFYEIQTNKALVQNSFYQ